MNRVKYQTFVEQHAEYQRRLENIKYENK